MERKLRWEHVRTTPLHKSFKAKVANGSYFICQSIVTNDAGLYSFSNFSGARKFRFEGTFKTVNEARARAESLYQESATIA